MSSCVRVAMSGAADLTLESLPRRGDVLFAVAVADIGGAALPLLAGTFRCKWVSPGRNSGASACRDDFVGDD